VEFLSYQIKSNDFKRAGDASRALKEHLKLVGADAESIRRTMIAAYEAEMNVVIHAQGGRMEAHLAEVGIHVDVIDNGPGIPNLDLAMKEGFSTANAEARALGFGAGMGLPNIKRSSDRLRVSSHVDTGTRVSFTVFFKGEATRAGRYLSLQASRALCQDCRRCLTACPTEAIRMRDHVPAILEHLCIDCGACVAACKPEALTIRNDVSSLDEITDREDALLVVPSALLVDCGAKYSPERALGALHSLGFADVLSITPYEEALRQAVAAASQAEEASLPLISPMCPAIVNLIELRFPSLIPHLAPFDSPLEAVQGAHPEQPMVYVVSCPSQRSALIAHEVAGGLLPGRETITEYVTPAQARQAAMEKLVEQPETTNAGATGAGTADAEAKEATVAEAAQAIAELEGTDRHRASGRISPTAMQAMEAHLSCGGPQTPRLVVTGVEHVVAVLEQLENGLLASVPVIEPYACEGGCFGSPFLQEDYHVSLHRWEEAEKTLATDVTEADGPAPQAIPRRLPVTARPGIRLDADMGLAIEKLGQLQTILESLPGKNCGACGAPTCTALAEDVVLERARLTDCPYMETKEGTSV
jgi:Na+-translocating ferredoxin:NAD+ oxidoreductase RNF subunit RnfB/anti-sigma regulatory factor (Ser/Thr protein kinase)